MKCQSHHYMGDFALNGKELRVRGLNRIGNLIVPNLNYVSFENWMMPILDDMVKEQVENVRRTHKKQKQTSTTMREKKQRTLGESWSDEILIIAVLFFFFPFSLL